MLVRIRYKRSMDARRLFVHVARAGSYAAAARELGIARTTAMRRVTALEAEVGLSLVQVAGTSLVLTQAGHRLAAEWQRLLRTQERIEQEVRASTGRLAGRLRVRLPVMGTGVGVVPALAAFSRMHPDIQIQLQQGWEPRVLEPGDFDVAMRIGHQVDPDLLSQKLFDVAMILVASREYIDEHGTAASVDDFPRHRAIQEWDLRGRLVHWYTVDGRRVRPPPVVVRAHGIGHVIGFALGGAGIACVPDALALPALEQGDLVQVVPEVQTSDSVSLVYLPDPTPTTRAFLDFMAERVRQRTRTVYDPTHLAWR